MQKGGRRRARKGPGWSFYLAIAVAVWLGSEILKAPVIDRAPPAIALRLSPTSPEVLRRAAEAEQAAERQDNAEALATDSLTRAPFNARALRVRGLAEAAGGDVDRADEMLTLAGNWSLRDDPTHAWLVEQRLRQGNYASAFGHADTLARRREDLNPQTFNLFKTAVRADPRAAPVVARLVAANPPWRNAYLSDLARRPGDADVAYVMAVLLQRTAAPMTNTELSVLYQALADRNQIPAARQLRGVLGRPASPPLLVNGDFSDADAAQIAPFAWAIRPVPGLWAEIMEDDLQPANTALRVTYSGRDSAPLVDQFLTLAPGVYALSGRSRMEGAQAEPSVDWTLVCIETGVDALTSRTGAPGAGWARFQRSVVIPATGCTAQWLRLRPSLSERRSAAAIWYDDMRIAAAPGRPG